VLESLAYLPTEPTWQQLANALYLADRDHHGGRFWSTIGEVLRLRGIRGAVTASDLRAREPAPGEPAEFSALPAAVERPGRYHWRVRSWCSGSPCEPWRDAATATWLVTVVRRRRARAERVVAVRRPRHDARVRECAHPMLVFDGPTRIVKNGTGTWSYPPCRRPCTLYPLPAWLVPGAKQELLGQMTSVTFAAAMSFQLPAELTDHMGRTGIAHIRRGGVHRTIRREGSRAPAMTQSAGSGRHAEIQPRADDATSVPWGLRHPRPRALILRQRARSPAASALIRWDPNVLEPGIYFVRATTASGHAAKLALHRPALTQVTAAGRMQVG
jgi:hypothetical protein